MNTKRIVVLVAGGVLVWLVATAMFTVASPDSAMMRDVATGQTQVVYSSEADRDLAEQLSIWSQVTMGLIVIVVAGLVFHGTRPGRWLRVEDESTTTLPRGQTDQ